jgi:hypothetical protein
MNPVHELSEYRCFGMHFTDFGMSSALRKRKLSFKSLTVRLLWSILTSSMFQRLLSPVTG